jgi:arsenate reductase (glutaredoxin)
MLRCSLRSARPADRAHEGDVRARNELLARCLLSSRQLDVRDESMTITLYGIKNCDTMKKARSWLASHEVQYAFHDYKTAGISPDVVARWCSEVGWETLLNRAGTTFRKLAQSQKEGLNERKAVSLMLAQPSMIKRPVLVYGNRLVVGFKPEVYAHALRLQA